MYKLSVSALFNFDFVHLASTITRKIEETAASLQTTSQPFPPPPPFSCYNFSHSVQVIPLLWGEREDVVANLQTVDVDSTIYHLWMKKYRGNL